jgi:uncharacterized membrane protein
MFAEAAGSMSWSKGALLTAVVIVVATVFVGGVGTLAVRCHLDLQTQMNDLGNADQALWRAASGDWRMTQSNDSFGELRSRFGVHVNLIFLPLSLMYLAWPDPRLLLMLTVAACAAAGAGLYALARARLGEEGWTLVPPCAFLMSPMVHDAALYDMHIITVASALVVWAIWAFEVNRPVLAYTMLLVAFACKEDIAVVGLMLAVVLAFRGQGRRGAVVAGMAVAYIALTQLVLVPFADRSDVPQAVSTRYGWLLSDPQAAVASLLRPDRLRLPVYFLLSGAIAAARGWRWFPLLLPHLGMGLLASTLWMTRITGTYYWILIEAVIVIACIEAAASSDGRVRRAPLVYLAVATTVLSFMLSPLPHGVGAWGANYRVDPVAAPLQRIAEQLPADAALCVQNNVGAHFSQRSEVAAIPKRLQRSEWVLLHVRYTSGPCSGLFAKTSPKIMYGMTPEELSVAAERLIRSKTWAVVAADEGFFLFQRDGVGSVDVPTALRRLRRDRMRLVSAYCQALEKLSPVAVVTTGRLSWDQVLLGQPLLTPGSLPGDPVSFHRRYCSVDEARSP